MSFGRKGPSGEDTELAARRATFLAEERARRQRPDEPAAEPSRLSEPAYVPQKTLGTAYLLWFVLGGLSAHRFYLGYSTSAIIQALLNPIGYAMLLSDAALGIPMVAAGLIWVVADAFLIPGMIREANARFRRDALAPACA